MAPVARHFQHYVSHPVAPCSTCLILRAAAVGIVLCSCWKCYMLSVQCCRDPAETGAVL